MVRAAGAIFGPSFATAALVKRFRIHTRETNEMNELVVVNIVMVAKSRSKVIKMTIDSMVYIV
jgi:hypothetical protein